MCRLALGNANFKRWLLRGVAAIALFALLTSCATVGPRFTEVGLLNPDHALIYIYRPNPPFDPLLMGTYDYAHAPDLYLNDKKLISLNVNASTYVETAPGVMILDVREKITGGIIDRIEFQANPAQRYYLKYRFAFRLAGAEMELRIMPKEIALDEIKSTRLLEAQN